jgi:hypothetical protein
VTVNAMPPRKARAVKKNLFDLIVTLFRITLNKRVISRKDNYY